MTLILRNIILGSTFLGYLDYWSGILSPSVRDYNVDAVLNSTTANILSQINGGDRLSLSSIRLLRNDSMVKCDFKNDERPCKPLKKPCLFHIRKDPCEQVNLNYQPSKKMNKFVQAKIDYFETLLNEFRKSTSTPGNVRGTKDANPVYYNNTWTNWGDINQSFVNI